MAARYKCEPIFRPAVVSPPVVAMGTAIPRRASRWGVNRWIRCPVPRTLTHAGSWLRPSAIRCDPAKLSPWGCPETSNSSEVSLWGSRELRPQHLARKGSHCERAAQR